MYAGGDDDPRCPQCRQFVKNADLIVQLMDDAERKMKVLLEDLHKYEWVVIENAQGIKNMRKEGLEVDEESFEVAFRQTKHFLRMLETINSHLNKMQRDYDDIDSYSNQTMGDTRY
jgi:hypothetical protein